MSPFFISTNMKANGGKYITFNLYEFLLFPKHEFLIIAQVVAADKNLNDSSVNTYYKGLVQVSFKKC